MNNMKLGTLNQHTTMAVAALVQLVQRWKWALYRWAPPHSS